MKSSSMIGPNISDPCRKEVPSGELSVLEWARERLENSIGIAASKSGADRLSWSEDVAYWTEIVRRLEALDGLASSEYAQVTVQLVARALRAKAIGIDGSPDALKLFGQKGVFALNHYASDLESGVWMDYLDD